MASSSPITLYPGMVLCCWPTDLVEEEVIDVVGEEGAQLALLGLAGAHVHLYLLDEAADKGTQDKH